ncbi:hypothetical protein [Streptomyces sp. NPDC005141]
MTERELLRTGALITAAALRGDDLAVTLLLNTLHPDEVRAIAIAGITAMAGLVREAVCPQALAGAIREAQQIAHEAATEGAQT